MSQHARALLVFGLSIIVAVPGVAGICSKEDTFNTCWLKVRATAENEEVEAQGERLSQNNTGVGSGATQADSSIADFLPLLGVAVESGGTDTNEPSMTLDLNNFLGLPTDHGYRLQAMIRDAELFEPLRKVLVDSDADPRIQELEESLGDLDDYTLVFSYSPMNKWLGRSIAVNRPLFSRMFQEVLGKPDSAGGIWQVFEEKLVANPLTKDLVTARGFGSTFESIKDPTLMAEGIATAEKVAQSYLQRERNIQVRAAGSRLFRYVDLVNNQPQLFGSIAVRRMDELVGPAELALKVTFEYGFVNVNSFRRVEAGCLKNAALSCLGSYLTEKRLKQLRRSDRLAISLEYTDIDDYNLVLADDGIVVAAPGDRSLVGTLSYGRYLVFNDKSEGKTRIDLNWSYEDYGDNPSRENRNHAALILSQNISDGVALSIGLSYASRPEFRDDPDEEINAHIGLTYKLTRPSSE